MTVAVTLQFMTSETHSLKDLLNHFVCSCFVPFKLKNVLKAALNYFTILSYKKV